VQARGCDFAWQGRWGRILTCLILPVFVLFSAEAEARSFSGVYTGLAEAEGYRLTVTEVDARIAGQLRPPGQSAFALNGHRTGAAAQGLLKRGAETFYFHMEERPLGLQFLLIPAGPDDEPDIAEAVEMSFLKEGLRLPDAPEEKQKEEEVPAPVTSQPLPKDILGFLEAFRRLEPKELAQVYGGLSGGERDLVQLFDHVAAELLWRICTGAPPHEGFSARQLEVLLERQQTGCEEYLVLVGKVRDAGLTGEFVRKVNFQLDILRETVRCDRGEEAGPRCIDIGAMRAPLIARWRPAKSIMERLAGDAPPVRSEGNGPHAAPVAVLPQENPAREAGEENALLPLARPGAEEASEPAPAPLPLTAGGLRLPLARP